MAKWTFEPGHTAAEFCARHMMVTNVRGHFKDVHGSLVFDPEDPTKSSTEVTVIGENDYQVTGELTIRGKTRPATLDVHYLGHWQTPWWEDGVNKGPRTRAGFVAKTEINRQDFGVSWNDTMDKGGIVVSNTLEITIDAEAILESE
jgi:polyisoprenoid-binding protein YceI